MWYALLHKKVPDCTSTNSTGAAAPVIVGLSSAWHESGSLRFRPALGCLLFALLMQIDANVFIPRLMSRSIAIHPLLVFTAMIAGGAIGGVVGMLVSAPVAAWLKIEFDKYIAKKEAEAGSL